MTDDGSAGSTGAWPLPKFYFEVEWGSEVMSFQEVSGLDVEGQPIEYRHGDSREFSTIAMPGIRNSGQVTLKKGVFRSDGTLREWLGRIGGNTTERLPVTIRLRDGDGSPTMVWTLADAWPTRITGTDLESDANEVAVESMELAHEGITVENP